MSPISSTLGLCKEPRASSAGSDVHGQRSTDEGHMSQTTRLQTPVGVQL